MYACLYTHMYVCVYMHIYTNRHYDTDTCIHTYVCIYIHIYMYTYVCRYRVCIYTYACIYTYTYTCMYVYICIYIYTYVYLIMHIHAYTSSCAWHAQRSSLEARGRGTLATYALESAEASCLPTAADRLAYPSADAPLFALVMAAALRDAGALCAACTSKNRCQKPRLSLRYIFWNKSRNQEDFFLIILVFYRLQRPLTRPVPSWAILPVITKSMSCHWIQNSGMYVAATHTHRYKHTP